MPNLKNPNHPKKGSSIKVQPIRDVKAIKRIKAILKADSPRNYCLFVLGINTAYRINELLSIKLFQVSSLSTGDVLDLKQSKNSRYRATTLNRAAYEALHLWLSVYDRPFANAPLFPSRKTGSALTVSTCSNMVKQWCADVGLEGNFGSHSLRKTWGYHQRVRFNQPTALISRALGHNSEKETITYLGIQSTEIGELYENEV